jgi:mono/diheme cytochrome c family protein
MRKLSLLLITAAFAGCSAPADSPAEAATAVANDEHVPVFLTEQQQEGKHIYESMCVACHGPAGRGDGAAAASQSVRPPTFHTQDFSRSTVASLMPRFQAALQGDDPSHPHMAQVASILDPEKFAAALSYIPALAYPPELPGSAIAGQQTYEYRCLGCHGVMGDGNGPAAASLTTVKPADFRTDTLLASMDWDAIFMRIRDGGQESVHGSSMPPWGVALDEAVLWDLVAYLGSFQGLLSEPRWTN